MKSVAVAAALLASSALAFNFNPSPAHEVGTSPVRARLHISQSKMRREAGGRNFKRCKPHSGSSSPGAAPAVTTTPAASAAPAPTSAAAATTTAASSGGGSSGGSSGDVINVKTSGCGDIGASSKTSKATGPNGSEDWLNCGIASGGWNPAMVRVSDLKYKDLGALMSGNSIFNPCKQYSDIIYDAAGKYHLPAIMIAAIMMQESTCNKDTVGGGGEQGLMQITKDKCGGAPGGNCKDPTFNIHTGSKYLADQIKNLDGNVLLAVGSYNGWYKGLTYDKATAAARSSCCRCQNNLDYPHQFFNGWMQGIDSYSTDLGTYKNLNVCN